MSLKRIQKELKDLQEDGKIDVDLVNDSLHRWHVALRGPEESPYEGGTFLIEIEFPANYPIGPPVAKFITRIFHPGISKEGSVCTASEKWNPKMTIADYLIPRLLAMLKEPSDESTMNPEASNLYVRDQVAFRTQAEEYTKTFAS